MKKKNMAKRILAIVLAAITATGLVGCGGNSNTKNASTSVKNTGSDSGGKEGNGIDTSSHEVITMLALGDKPTNGRLEAMLEQLNKALTKR